MERFDAKRGKLSHVVVQRKQLCSDKVRRRVTSQTKKVVCNVFAYLERQAKKAKVSSSPLIRTVKVTGLSRATMIRIKRELRRLPEDVEFPSPAKRYCRTRKRIVPADNFDREAIRLNIVLAVHCTS